MSTMERREFHQSRVTRTVSPPRTLSNQNLSTFDNNLDNLLEDLQSSVSRPGSSLGNANTYKETRTVTYGGGKTDSLGRVQHLTAANPTTIIADDSYSYKPGETVKTVKTYKENYASYNVNSNISPEKARMQSNINKLDTLLDDLQQARQGTLNRGISDSGIDPGLLEPATGTNKVVSKKTVHRELVYDGDSPRNKRGGSVEREIYVNRELDGTYGDIRPIHHQTSSPSSRSGTLQKTYNYSSESHNNVSPQTEIIESNKPDINPNILAQLDPNLLPPPNTKVTTTIKTYTYEIPGSGYPSTVSPKLSETVYSSNPSTPSQSFAYNKVENTSTNTNLLTNYPESYVRPVSPNPSGHTTTKYVENVTTTRNVNDGYPPLGFNTTPTPGKKTYIYNENTTRNINHPGPNYPVDTAPRSPRLPRSPPPIDKQVHIYNKTTTTNVNNSLSSNEYPPNRYPEEPTRGPPGTHHTYIVNETNTTRNTTSPYPRNGYPPNQDPGQGYPPNQPGQGYPPNQPGHTTVIYKHDHHTSNNYGPNGPPYPDGYDPNKKVPPYGGKPHDRDPRDPNLNITYKYTTHSTSSNNYRGHPNDETEPLLHPRPFPTDPNNEIDGPPKHLDKLMAEIGREPPNNAFNAGYAAKEAERANKKEVDKLTEQSATTVATQKKVEIKDLPKTKNVAGPPVYYPPGHEMFSHKEESGGYRAEGGMMKESGKYKYEASSSSKTKTSGGVAMVPVCLPLCCGLPCVIM